MACCRTWTICICTNGVLDTPSLLIILSNILYIILSTREYGYGVWIMGMLLWISLLVNRSLKKHRRSRCSGTKHCAYAE